MSGHSDCMANFVSGLEDPLTFRCQRLIPVLSIAGEREEPPTLML